MTKPRFLPVAQAFEEISGYRPSVPTMLRWIVSGKKGVRLKAYQLCGTWKTTTEYAQQFLDETTQATIDGRTQAPAAPARSRSESARAKAIAKAEKELASSGV